MTRDARVTPACAWGSAFDSNRTRWTAAMAAAAKLKMALIQHSRDRGGIALAGIAGELAGGQPGSPVPEPGLEPGVEMDELRLQPCFTRLSHGSAVELQGEWGIQSRPPGSRCLMDLS